MAKPRVDSTEGRVALYDLMLQQDKLCEELCTYLPPGARIKFNDLRALRPAQYWNKIYLENLKTLAMSAYLVELYQEKEAVATKKDNVSDAKSYNSLMRSNITIVNHYMTLLQLKPTHTVSPDMREAGPKLEVEKSLTELKDGGNLGLYAH